MIRLMMSALGSLGGWAVGNTPEMLPEEFAISLPKGSDIVLQMHFYPTGKPETERSADEAILQELLSSRQLSAIQRGVQDGTLKRMLEQRAR